MHKLGAIGAGHMGMVIIDSLVCGKLASPAEVLVFEIDKRRAEQAQMRGYAIVGSETEVYTRCEYVLLAVLPQQCVSLLTDLSGCAPASPPVVISIVSGISSAFIRQYLGERTPVINVVPNLTLSVGAGATAISRTPNVLDEIFLNITEVFSSLGEIAIVEEPLLKEIIAANGCAPGYAFFFMDAVARTVAARGVDYSLAVRMTAKAFEGAAQMALAGEKDPSALCAQVCSPGGLTVQAIDHFNEHGLADTIASGIVKSIERGYELAK